MARIIIFFFFFTLIALCYCNKYSEKMNSPDLQKVKNTDKPFRMQKLNLIWGKALKKLPKEKLKLLHTDLKFQDKEELSLKKLRSENKDKDGLKEGLVLASFNAILEKYGLTNEFKLIQDSVRVKKGSSPDMPNDAYIKSIFRDKRLNKLWMKAEQQGFSESEMNALKEEFLHHQNKVDQYYQMINQLHAKPGDDEIDNAVDKVLEAEVGEKPWKADNPQQMIKEKHQQLKAGIDYLAKKVLPDIKKYEFEEPQVNALWEMARNGSFSNRELDSLKKELHHFEHRIKKLKTLTELEMETDPENLVHDAVIKRDKKLKEYGYKIEKIQKELTSRILQKHSEL